MPRRSRRPPRRVQVPPRDRARAWSRDGHHPVGPAGERRSAGRAVPGALVGRVVPGALGEGQVVQREHEGHVARKRQRRGAGTQATSSPPPTRRSSRGVRPAPPRRRPAGAGCGERRSRLPGATRRAGRRGRAGATSPPGTRRPARRRARRCSARRPASPARRRGCGRRCRRSSAGNVPPVQPIDSAPYMEEGNGSISRVARVALIHDFLLDVRGAERVFAALCDLYPAGRPLHGRLRRAGDGGLVRASGRQHVVPPAVAADRPDVPPAAAALSRTRWRRSTSPATTS